MEWNSWLVLLVDIISITISADEKFLKTGEDPLLTIGSAGHALSVFVKGQFVGQIQIVQRHLHGIFSLSFV